MSRLSGMPLLEQINLISTDPVYALGFPEAATLTGITKKIIPVESALHPHSDHLVAEQQKKAKKKRERRDALDLEKTKKRMLQQVDTSQNMRRGGRVKLIDGCAVSGKTRGRTV